MPFTLRKAFARLVLPSPHISHYIPDLSRRYVFKYLTRSQFSSGSTARGIYCVSSGKYAAASRARRAVSLGTTCFTPLIRAWLNNEHALAADWWPSSQREALQSPLHRMTGSASSFIKH